jgi:hypothetical protein
MFIIFSLLEIISHAMFPEVYLSLYGDFLICLHEAMREVLDAEFMSFFLNLLFFFHFLF